MQVHSYWLLYTCNFVLPINAHIDGNFIFATVVGTLNRYNGPVPRQVVQFNISHHTRTYNDKTQLYCMSYKNGITKLC